jgi:hypothetical protein
MTSIKVATMAIPRIRGNHSRMDDMRFSKINVVSCAFILGFPIFAQKIPEVPRSWGKPVSVPHLDVVSKYYVKDLKLVINFLRKGHDVVPVFSSKKHTVPDSLDLYFCGSRMRKINGRGLTRSQYIKDKWTYEIATNRKLVGKKWTSLEPGQPVMLFQDQSGDCSIAIDIKGNRVYNPKF